MDIQLRDSFTRLWDRYFEGEDLPITAGIRGDPGPVKKASLAKHWRCIVCDLARIRKGIDLAVGEEALSCSGAQFYLGYTDERRPGFRYFLSTGKAGEVEGERYKRTPEIVDAMARGQHGRIPATGKYYIFKRWDRLSEDDHPEVVIFFARPEVLSGLFTLAQFDQSDPNGGVISPFGAGCGSMIYWPLLEQQKAAPRAVLGMFDPSARPCVPLDVLTFAVPMKKFSRMIGYMEESFLTTPTWEKVQEKIRQSRKLHTEG